MIKRVLVVSDSHGNVDCLKETIRIEKPDILIHLGDLEYPSPKKIEQFLNSVCEHEKSIFIRGNCDRRYTDQLTPGLLFDLNGHRVLATHGHGFYVDQVGTNELLSFAIENDCDMVMFGHTHMWMDEIIHGVRFLNPGSIAYPQRGEKASYMVMMFNDDEKYVIEKKIVG